MENRPMIKAKGDNIEFGVLFRVIWLEEFISGVTFDFQQCVSNMAAILRRQRGLTLKANKSETVYFKPYVTITSI